MPDDTPSPLAPEDLAALRAALRRLRRQVRWLTVMATVALGLALLALGLLLLTLRDLDTQGLLH